MQRFLSFSALVLALGNVPGSAVAFGFGKVGGTTTLGHPLNFSVAVRLDADERIEAACVTANVVSGDRPLPSQLVRTRIDMGADPSERIVRVRTTNAVDEPVVSIELRISCPTRLSRSFVVFADPPSGREANSPPADTNAEASETSGSPLSALLPTTPAASRPAVSSAARSRVPVLPRTRDSSSPASARSPATLSPASRPGKPVLPPKPSRGPVLQLDPLEAEAMVVPMLRMDSSLARLPDAAAVAGSAVAPRFIDPEQLQRLREQERLKTLEGELNRLRADGQATQKSLAEIQGRLREAEATRYANPIFYLLLALSAALAIGLIVMWRLRLRDRDESAWWAAAAQAKSEPDAASEAVVEEPVLMVDDDGNAPEKPAPPKTPEPPVLTQQVASPPPGPPPITDFSVDLESSLPALSRPMSADELIDLEQQAEFFVVLGQDDAAIDLLMGHVRQTGGVSPLPYLKLLEIYRRRAELEPYNRIRERFNHRFNAYAPEWQIDPESGLSLEGYPEVLHKLQDAWEVPSQAMSLLDGALFRRNVGPTFDIPAYRQLLFLYGIARDLGEHDQRPEGVDLLLPLSESDKPMVSSMPPTMPPSTSSAAHEPPIEPDEFVLDLDVSSDPSPLSGIEAPNDIQFRRDSRLIEFDETPDAPKDKGKDSH
jgi:hypothetical protein